jgi:hypothetical protein
MSTPRLDPKTAVRVFASLNGERQQFSFSGRVQIAHDVALSGQLA